MISKEDFCRIIKRLRDYNDLQDEIDELFEDSLENRESDFCNAGSICIGHETVVVELLENMFNDKAQWISWWIYEQDYGRTILATEVEVNDNYIDLTTPEKLYDYLIKEMEEKDYEEDD